MLLSRRPFLIIAQNRGFVNRSKVFFQQILQKRECSSARPSCSFGVTRSDQRFICPPFPISRRPFKTLYIPYNADAYVPNNIRQMDTCKHFHRITESPAIAHRAGKVFALRFLHYKSISSLIFDERKGLSRIFYFYAMIGLFMTGGAFLNTLFESSEHHSIVDFKKFGFISFGNFFLSFPFPPAFSQKYDSLLSDTQGYAHSAVCIALRLLTPRFFFPVGCAAARRRPAAAP